MATIYKSLGQAAPAATTATNVYTVPAGYSAVISSISICNRSASNVTYRLSLRPAGATQANQHYIAYDVTLGAADTTILQPGLTMAATDVLTVYASTADTSWTISGSEISA